MSEQKYYVELTFPKRDLIEILEAKDEKALLELLEETFNNYLNTQP